jgi:transglutaminase-like putative cysteine protease
MEDQFMILDINVLLEYDMIEPTDLILQIEAQISEAQRVISETIQLGTVANIHKVKGEGGIGQRVLIPMDSNFVCTYSARLDIKRSEPDISNLSAAQRYLLPSEAVRCLMPSRYCHSDQLLGFVTSEFGHTTGGQRIVAIRDWIFDKIEYVCGSSNSQTTATDTMVKRQGVCRDFAHILIALARASGIPARFVSVYAPFVIPQDFHAVAEVYLDNAWHLVDATKMAKADQMAIIGAGLDAAEVSFLSSYDPINFRSQSVQVTADI